MLDEDLAKASTAALTLNPQDCRKHALRYSWTAATQQFLANLQPIGALAGAEYRQDGGAAAAAPPSH